MKFASTTFLSLAAVLCLGVSANAQTCVADQFGTTPNCTANDQGGFVFQVDNVDAPCNGNTAQLDLTLVFQEGNAAVRYDVGAFIATDGGDAETTGTCARALAQAGVVGATDADGDACLDKQSTTGIEMAVTDVVVDCSSGAVVSACVTWGQNSAAVDTDGDDLCSDVDDLEPGTASKCICGSVDYTDLPPGTLPVELASFGGEVDGSSVALRWETHSETNNAGFSVEHSFGDRLFEEVGFVDGAGTTSQSQRYNFSLDGLNPGKHVFRLKQIDFDGAFEYSTEIELAVGVPDKYVLEAAYPNPFNPSATINFLVAESGPVKVDIFNILGVHQGTLYDGTPEANTTETVLIDGTDLPSGIYVVRIVGTNFTGSQQVTLLK